MAWDYQTLFISPENLNDLQIYGNTSWEAFAAAPIGGISNLWVVWLKRPNYEDTEAEGAVIHEFLQQEAELQSKRRGRPPKGE
jgi:hypothetical protein